MKTVGSVRDLLGERGLLVSFQGNENAEKQEIVWMTYDSRRVKPGTLFFCKGKGFCSKYLEDAVADGCIAYVIEEGSGIQAPSSPVSCLEVRDIRKAMAVLGADFFGYVPGQPFLTGITGTKGKTTTAWYLKGMLDAWEKERGGRETGMISSVQNYDGRLREDAVMTTPEALILQEHLAHAREEGLEYMTMEVSSQALKYKRVRELRFQVGIFLNISEDHISPGEHADFEDYFSSKLSIFRQTETACVNLDSQEAERILKAARKARRTVTFGRSSEADIRYHDIRMENGRITFEVECDRFKETFSLAMRGVFNIENAAAAIAAAYVYGVPVHCMKEALENVRVPGRMETYFSRDGRICGIVDFAHNRLSFERLFDAVYQEYPQYRRIVCVFGCPGSKALNRRRDLGLIAGLFSDKVYLTTDDPASEQVQDIAAETGRYVELAGCPCEYIEDREQAICRAVEECGVEKTLILVLGKGSEKFQKIGGKAYAYPTDAELLEQAIRQRDGWRQWYQRA